MRRTEVRPICKRRADLGFADAAAVKLPHLLGWISSSAPGFASYHQGVGVRRFIERVYLPFYWRKWKRLTATTINDRINTIWGQVRRLDARFNSRNFWIERGGRRRGWRMGGPASASAPPKVETGGPDTCCDLAGA